MRVLLLSLLRRNAIVFLGFTALLVGDRILSCASWLRVEMLLIIGGFVCALLWANAVLVDRGHPVTYALVSLLLVPGLYPIGIVALLWAFSPPELISEFYTAGVGVLSASLFVPTIAGLWWKKANVTGGVGAVLCGSIVYVLVQTGIVDVGLAPVVVALFASGAAMVLGGLLGPRESTEMIQQIEALHG